MSEWISCEDAVPDAGYQNNVWAFGVIDGGPPFMFSAWVEKDYGWCSLHCREDSEIEVTHWMKPNPPTK